METEQKPQVNPADHVELDMEQTGSMNEPPTVPSSTQPIVKPRGPSKKVIVIIVIIVVAVLAIAGIAIALLRGNNTSTSSSTPSTTSTSHNSASTADADAASTAITGGLDDESSSINTDDSSLVTDASSAAQTVGDSINENDF